MQHIVTKVSANTEIALDYHALDFVMPPDFQVPEPGQFLTIRVGEGISPLLRRPFAFADCDSGTGLARIIYEKRGKATLALSDYKPGDKLDIVSPLGNTFPLPSNGNRPVLVAGGIGIGPMLFLYGKFKAMGLDPILVLGSRNGDRIPLLPEGVLICTDDGSRGMKGNVLKALGNLDTLLTAGSMPEFYACGPHIMMEKLYFWALERYPEARTWVSLEQTMACAVGACMGCVVKVNHPKPFARVCTEGPVFDAAFINWKD